jgi:hypothetical protein
MCEINSDEIAKRKKKNAKQLILKGDRNLSADHKIAENEQKFWILVNKAEAHFGLGEIELYNQSVERAKKTEHTQWMWKAFDDEVRELRELMKIHGHLLNPPWKDGAGLE